MSLVERSEYCRSTIGLEYCVFHPEEGLIPPDFWIQIPCGTCFACLKRKRQEWSFRLIQEIFEHSENSFVTLTFDDEHLAKFADDYKRPLKLYVDRLRKRLGFRPRYWFISELGEENGRFHIHGIIFGTSKDAIPYSLMRSLWPYGRSDYGWVNCRTCNYLTKYLLKFQGDFKPFIMCSNGIGASYLSKKPLDYFVNGFDVRSYAEFMGVKYPLSVYYKSKIFTDDLKVCFMLNRVMEHKQFSAFLNGKEYKDKYLYQNARNSYFQKTLKLGLSKPLKRKNYGKICISES